MRPITGANGNTVNWINYRTGTRDLYFRMDAGSKYASVSIELKHSDSGQHQHYYEQLEQVRSILEQETGEKWDWVKEIEDENGQMISRISITLKGVNIFNEADWPAVISFFKPRIIALDRFWNHVKEEFE